MSIASRACRASPTPSRAAASRASPRGRATSLRRCSTSPTSSRPSVHAAGSNVCHSLMRMGGRFGMRFVAATPATYEPRADFVASAAEDALANGGSVELVTDPREAVRGAAAVYTDVWTSMGQEEARDRRLRDLEPYRIDDALLALADREAVAMHCLPAHVREEISAEVLYGPRRLAWEQA